MRTNKNVRGIVKKDGSVLLIHRFKNGDEYWVVPGGGVEEGETLEEALYREMKEETNLDVKSFTCLKSIETENGEQYIYQCEMSDGEIKLQGPELESMDENNQYILTWLPTDDVLKLKTLYPDCVKEYL